jgi:hypothetical protein
MLINRVLYRLCLVTFLLKSLNSFCQTTSYYPTSIIVGQDTGCGIKSNISTEQCGPAVNPWNGGSQSCTIDLDADGKIDLMITSDRSPASQLGGGYFKVSISAGDSCFICVQSMNHGLADSIKINDIIDSSKTWGKNGNLRYNTWSANGSSYSSGYEPSYYGVKIKNGSITTYGWVASSINNYAITGICTTNGIKSITLANEIKVYPNPASDELIFEPNVTNPISIVISDISGRFILGVDIFNKTSIDTKNLSEGVYILGIKSSDKISKQKLVITR